MADYQDTSNYIPSSPLGRRLWEIRERALARGYKVLSLDEVLLEVRRRRGEVDVVDAEEKDGEFKR
ncbi:MAG: hypothetical protein QXT73_02335 [Candidatus Methanomethylicaceae archaeon]